VVTAVFVIGQSNLFTSQ